MGQFTTGQRKNKGNAVLTWVWDHTVDWPAAFSCEPNAFPCELICRCNGDTAPLELPAEMPKWAQARWDTRDGEGLRKIELGACLGVCMDFVGFGVLSRWTNYCGMIIPHQGREHRGPCLCERNGSYHGERVERTWEKELACEKHHRHDEGLGVFSSGSVHDKYLLENTHYLSVLLFYSSIMYSIQWTLFKWAWSNTFWSKCAFICYQRNEIRSLL